MCFAVLFTSGDSGGLPFCSCRAFNLCKRGGAAAKVERTRQHPRAAAFFHFPRILRRRPPKDHTHVGRGRVARASTLSFDTGKDKLKQLKVDL